MSSRRGLTIMEVALATAILAIMATLTWGSISRSFDAYETVSDIDGRYHNVRVAMNRMAKEISMAFLTSPTRSMGRELMWETIFKGKSATPFYELNFTSLSHQVLRADAKESDQSEIAYFGEADPDRRGVINLMRREDPRIDSEPDEGGRAYILAENVKEFRLRFFDPKDDDWVDEWDTEDSEFTGRLPTIVEIHLVVEDIGGEDLDLMTKTRINLTTEFQRF